MYEMQPDDATLVRRCLDGNLGAFDVLMTRYEKMVFNLARRMVHDSDATRDVTQTVFLKAFEKLGTFDDRYAFRSWIGKIAVNEALDLVERHRRTELLDETWPAPDRDPAQALGAAETSRRVERALLALPPEQRAVVLLRHYLDLSYAEMAVSLGIPEKTVKSRLFSARTRLKDELSRHEQPRA